MFIAGDAVRSQHFHGNEASSAQPGLIGLRTMRRAARLCGVQLKDDSGRLIEDGGDEANSQNTSSRAGALIHKIAEVRFGAKNRYRIGRGTNVNALVLPRCSL
jgi:hypothetical protein